MSEISRTSLCACVGAGEQYKDTHTLVLPHNPLYSTHFVQRERQGGSSSPHNSTPLSLGCQVLRLVHDNNDDSPSFHFVWLPS